MIKKSILSLGIFFILGCSGTKPKMVVSESKHAAAQALFLKTCASCHGPDRLGLTGPALFSDSLERLKKKDAKDTILNGRKSTQMQAFKSQITEAEVDQLIEYLYTPIEPAPQFGLPEMKASQILGHFEVPLGERPIFKADPLNLFCVVELGDHSVTVLDGDKFEPLTRFKTRFSLHGGIKYSPDGRYAYWVSRDGWVTKYDLYNLVQVAEIRAGLNTRNIAISADGKYVAVGNTLPQTLVILDSKQLDPIKIISGASIDGKPSRISAVYSAPPRNSFIVALKDVPELWEISYREGARAPYTGLVHDYKTESGEDLSTKPEPFPIRRIALDVPLDDFFFDLKYDNLLGTSRLGNEAHVVNLIVGRPTHKVPVSGMPHLASGILWKYKGHYVMATPNLKEGKISIVDTESWKVVSEAKTPAPGFFLRSHENSKYAWADVFFGKEKDTLLLLDKKTLKIAKTLRLAPGKTAAHVEFTRDGKYALVSLWEDDGELLVIDSRSLKTVKRIPMKKPSGKYNVWNKTRLSEGTSH